MTRVPASLNEPVRPRDPARERLRREIDEGWNGGDFHVLEGRYAPTSRSALNGPRGAVQSTNSASMHDAVTQLGADRAD